MTAPRELAQGLEQVGGAAAKELRRRRARDAALAEWGRGAGWMLVVPLAVLLLHGIEWWLGVATFRAPAWLVAAAALAPVLALAFVVLQRQLAARTETRAGLAQLDRELAAEGRLQTAHEFLGVSAPSAFMHAAIEDAGPHVERAWRHRLVQAARHRRASRTVLAPLAALLLAWLAGWSMPPAAASGDAPDGGSGTGTETRHPTNRRDPETARAEPVAMPKVDKKEERARLESAKAGSEERKPTEDTEQPVRESEGKSGEGASANAQSGSSSSESKGFQSSQAPPTDQATAKAPPKKKPKPQPKPKASDAAKKKLEQSGSTAGKGTGSGSNKNPSSTEWQSKDQVSTDEEQPLAEDLDVEDETDESEARGGLQPSLRDRRPAVNRDLNIGFGNAPPPPDANGRGGPGEQKKSRGVASLVLGVPIPDHVKGQLNPGKIKVTQERVEPRADQATATLANARAERDRPIGSLRRAELAPWMRELVRTYFLQLRTRERT